MLPLLAFAFFLSLEALFDFDVGAFVVVFFCACVCVCFLYTFFICKFVFMLLF